MATAVIVDAVRTAGGKRNGKLSGWHPADLAAEMLKALVERNDLDPALVDDVIMGCVMQVGAQSLNVGRNAVLAAGWPESVPATTIDRQCGSSQQSAHFAAQGVMAGRLRHRRRRRRRGHEPRAHGRLGQVTASASRSARRHGALRRAPAASCPQGISAEIIADKWGLSREDLDAFGAQSQQRAAPGHRRGPLRQRDHPRPGQAPRQGDRRGHRDRRDASPPTRASAPAPPPSRSAKLKPAFKPDGKVTAGNSSQITDGASAVLIMSEEKANELGLTPRARFHTFALAGVDPVTMLTGPIPATAEGAREGRACRIDDIDLIEINEAFASVVLAWEKEHNPDMEQGQRQRRRHRPRPPARRLGHQAAGHAAQRARAHRRPLRPPDHVRGRRPGQRHHHRAPGLIRLGGHRR